MTLVTTGQQLHAARVLLGYSQKRVAERLGISRHTMQRVEHDRPTWRLNARAVRELYLRNGIVFLEDGVQRTPRLTYLASSVPPPEPPR